MDITTYESLNIKKSEFISVSVEDLVFDDNYVRINGSESYGDIYITDTMRESLCRFVGLSPSLNKGLYTVDKELWYQVLHKLYKYHGKSSIILLVSSEDSEYYVKGVCNTTREPISNRTFIDKVMKYFEGNSDCTIDDITVTDDALNSSIVLLFNKSYTGFNNRPFKLGIVFTNYETQNVICRAVMKYVGSEVYYLPPNFCNLSTSRYDRTTESSAESLDMLMLRVSEDFTEDFFNTLSVDVISKISLSYSCNISLHEFERMKVVLLNMCRTSDFSEEYIDDILYKINKYNDFEKLYGEIDKDYLWKCTAISENSLGDILQAIDSITTTYTFYPESVAFLRDLLGEYLMGTHVCQHIAKRL